MAHLSRLRRQRRLHCLSPDFGRLPALCHSRARWHLACCLSPCRARAQRVARPRPRPRPSWRPKPPASPSREPSQARPSGALFGVFVLQLVLLSGQRPRPEPQLHMHCRHQIALCPPETRDFWSVRYVESLSLSLSLARYDLTTIHHALTALMNMSGQWYMIPCCYS